jgi:hypothetical protein
LQQSRTRDVPPERFAPGSVGIIQIPEEQAIMAKKFDPAPIDKHAEDPKRARDADRKIDKDLDEGLKGSFPGSDPVSAAQPVKSRPDANPTIVEDGEHGPAGAKHPK